MKVVDIATEIHIEIGQPTDTSIASIAYWVRSKTGEINNLLFESFEIDEDTYEILDANGDEISINAVSVIKKLYKVYYYEVQIRGHMSAVSTDTILEVTDQGSSVKKINRNEVSKTLATLKRAEQDELSDLISSYKIRLSTPNQVTGDDTASGTTEIDSIRF